jgi:hypothetical protein
MMVNPAPHTKLLTLPAARIRRRLLSDADDTLAASDEAVDSASLGRQHPFEFQQWGKAGIRSSRLHDASAPEAVLFRAFAVACWLSTKPAFTPEPDTPSKLRPF